MKNIWKKAAAFALALTLTAGAVPVQLRVLSGGTALVASATEESETFDTNTGEEIYTETHFKIEVDAPGDENGFYVNPDGINKATIIALDEAVITKIVVVRGAGDDEPAIASETVEKTQDGDTFTFTNLNDTAVMLTGYGLTACQIKKVTIYYAMKTRIDDAAVTLGSDHKVSSVTVNGTKITDLSGFDITYGDDFEHIATDVPQNPGYYHAYVTAKNTNETYLGTAKSPTIVIVPSDVVFSSGVNIMLADDLALNFYINELYPSDTEKYMVKFSGKCAENGKIVALTAHMDRVFASAHIYANHMDEKITAELYAVDPETGKITGEVLSTKTFSAYDYLTADFSEYPQKVQDMVSATLEFGKAADNYFDGASETLHLMSRDDARAMAAEYAPTMAYSSSDGGGVSNSEAGFSLLLDSKMRFRVYFNYALFSSGPLKVYRNNEVLYDSYTLEMNTENNNSYYAEIKDLLPQDLDDWFAFQAKTPEGTVTLSCSALTWCYRVLEEDSGASEKNLDLASAVLAYAKAAETYITVDVTGVSIINPPLDPIGVGLSGTLKASVYPDDAADKTVTWAVTEGADVLSVDEETGAYKALKEGTAIVTATAGGVTESREIKVYRIGVGTVILFGEADLNGYCFLQKEKQDYAISEKYRFSGTATVSLGENWTHSALGKFRTVIIEAETTEYKNAQDGSDAAWMSSEKSVSYMKVDSFDQTPTGIKIVSGKGTEANPYSFALVMPE